MKLKIYADYKNPIVQAKAIELTKNTKTIAEKLQNIFLYVRDEIKFGYPSTGDLTTASETIRLKLGQCNTKGTLFLALCRAIGIPARIHYSTVDKEIQHGLFPSWAYNRFPQNISHSWVEIKYQNKWIDVDAFINDKEFYNVGKCLLKQEERKIGYSIACTNGESGIELDLEDAKFVQMDAVTEDVGIYDDPGEHFVSDLYKNRPNWFLYVIYRLAILVANKRVKNLRSNPGSYCGVTECCSH